MLRYGISAFCYFCFLSFGWSACAQENRAPLPLSKKDILQGQSATAESASLKELSQKLETIERDMGNIQSESGLKAREVQRLEAEVQTLNQDIIDIDLINNDLGVLIANDTLKWLPDSSFIGNHLLKIRVTDSHINFNNDFDIVLSVFSKPVFLNSPPKDAYVGLDYIYEPKVNFFSLNNGDLELIESSSDQIKLTNNKIIWTHQNHNMPLFYFPNNHQCFFELTPR